MQILPVSQTCFLCWSEGPCLLSPCLTGGLHPSCACFLGLPLGLLCLAHLQGAEMQGVWGWPTPLLFQQAPQPWLSFSLHIHYWHSFHYRKLRDWFGSSWSRRRDLQINEWVTLNFGWRKTLEAVQQTLMHYRLSYSLLGPCQPPYIEMHVANKLPAKAIILWQHGLCARAEQCMKRSCSELSTGGGKKYHQVLARCRGYMFIWVFHAAVFVGLMLLQAAGAVEWRGSKGEEGNGAFRKSGHRQNVWGSYGQMLMSAPEPWFSFWSRQNHIWPVLDVFWMRRLAFWQCLVFSMTVADGTGWDGETSTMIGDEYSHVWPITFLSMYMMLLHISELLWDVPQKEYGDPWVIPGFIPNYWARAECLMPQSWAWLHKTTSCIGEQCYILQSAVCDLCCQD